MIGSTSNYARNTVTGEYVFFYGELPNRFACSALENWCFNEVPGNKSDHAFEGQLVGEDPEARCIRLRHRPKHKQCRSCRPLQVVE